MNMKLMANLITQHQRDTYTSVSVQGMSIDPSITTCHHIIMAWLLWILLLSPCVQSSDLPSPQHNGAGEQLSSIITQMY
jgi:hypothetical protein